MAEQRSGGNYYDDQFADRINSISTGNASPPRAPGSGGGKAGCGGTAIVIVVVAVLRVLASGCTSSSRYSTPTPQYSPPTYTAPAPPPRDQFNDILEQQRRQDEEERQRLRERLRNPDPDFKPGRGFEKADKDRPPDPEKKDKGRVIDPRDLDFTDPPGGPKRP
jgi:hypothetical protein